MVFIAQPTPQPQYQETPCFIAVLVQPIGDRDPLVSLFDPLCGTGISRPFVCRLLSTWKQHRVKGRLKVLLKLNSTPTASCLTLCCCLWTPRANKGDADIRRGDTYYNSSSQ